MSKLSSTLFSRYLALLLVGVLTPIALVSGVAFAQQPPGIPLIVSGTVTLNGSPAPDGLNLTAWDGTEFVGSTTTSAGNYTVEVCGTAGQTCSGGDTISFELGGLTTSQTTTFSVGGVVTLNLAFTGTPTQAAVTTTPTTTTTSTTSTPIPEYGNILLVLLVTLGVGAVASSLLAKRHRGTEG